MEHTHSLRAFALAALVVTAACAHRPEIYPPGARTPSAPSHVLLALTVPVETSLGVPGVADTRAVWLTLLDGARRSIDLEQFYIADQPGEALVPVLAALRAAAARGVAIRVIVDRRFLATYPDSVHALGALPGVEARVVDYGPRGGVQHAKFFIVDGASVFLGSANFDWRALQHIHEVGARIDVPSVARDLSAVFARDWSDAVPEDPSGDTVPAPVEAPAGDAPDDPTVTLLASPRSATPPSVHDTLDTLVAVLDAARSTVSIQVYEYALRGHEPGAQPDTVLDSALRRAAARRVSVRLLVDASALRRGGDELRGLAGVHGIDVRTVTLPRWSGGDIPFARLVHSKYMVVDDTLAWVGTENWDPGYFHNTRNVGVLLRDPVSAHTLTTVFDRLWTSSYATPLVAAVAAVPLSPP